MSELTEPLGLGGAPNAPSLPRPYDGSQSILELIGSDTSPGGACLTMTAIGTNWGIIPLHFFRARGTKDAPLPVLENDTLMSIGIRAWSGIGFEKSSAAIQAFAAENSDGKSMIGSYVTIETSKIGSGIRNKQVYVLDTGHLRFSAYGAGALTTDANGNVISDSTILNRIAALEAKVGI